MVDRPPPERHRPVATPEGNRTMTDQDDPADARPDDPTPGKDEPRTLSRAPRRDGPSMQGPPSVIDLIERRTGRATKVLLPDEDSAYGVSSVVQTGTRSSEQVPAGRGNYQVLGELARGGMGVVLKGRDTDLGRDVAMKVLLEEHAESDAILQRFVEEAQIGGQLQHPGIVPVYELGLLDDDRPYFTMKLVKGRTLAALFRERKSPEDDRHRFLGIFEQVCQTIAYAHARKVVHRDLKPANIMVGAFGEVQVVDWGLAKVLREGGVEDERLAKRELPDVSIIETVRSSGSSTADSESMVGSIMGTPSYMSPEQAQGEIERLDERTDVFSLGALLTEILTGKPPYTGEQGRPIEEAARARQEPARKRLEACGAEPELIELALSCLSAARSGRPANAGELSNRMHDFLANREQRAREAQLEAAESKIRVEQARKARRLTLALATTVVLAVLGGGWGWMHVRDTEAQQLAEESARRDELTRNVAGILQDAQLARGRGDYAEALVAVERAETVLAATADPDAELAPRVAELRDEVERAAAAAEAERAALVRTDSLLSALDDIRFATVLGSERDRLTEKDVGYIQAFAAYDVDVLGAADEADERAVVEALRATGHAERVAQALDDWARARLWLDGFGSHNFQLLMRLAMEVDPDPWRLRLRRAIVTDDRRTLEALIDSRDAYDWPASTVVMFHQSLDILGHALDTVPLLRATQMQHPSDHALARVLGITLNDRADREPSPEALAYLQAARALRPEDNWAAVLIMRQYLLADRVEDALDLLRSQLAVTQSVDWWFTWVQPRLTDALIARGEHEATVQMLEIFLPSKPDDTFTLNNLAWFLTVHPDPDLRRPDRALEAARRSHELDPEANTWNTLGTALFRAGRYREAVEALTESMRLTDGGDCIEWLIVAMCLEELGLHDDARAWFRRGETGFEPLGGRVSAGDYNPFYEGEVELPDEAMRFLVEARAVFGDDAGG